MSWSRSHALSAALGRQHCPQLALRTALAWGKAAGQEGEIESAVHVMQANRGFGTAEVIAKVAEAAFGKPLVTNVLRGQVAEAIVALALEPEWDWCSADYSGWDFERSDGLRLEVKHSAARQSWATTKPSKAIFDVAARTGYWVSSTEWIAGIGRAAHLYIFAHHGIYDDHADHRDPSQWDFYVVPTSALPDIKQISLGTIKTITTAVSIDELAAAVRSVANDVSRSIR